MFGDVLCFYFMRKKYITRNNMHFEVGAQKRVGHGFVNEANVRAHKLLCLITVLVTFLH